MTNCVIVRAYGRQLDQLRGEASRISRANKIGWWIEREVQGARFCFEDAEAKRAFVSICENIGVSHIDGAPPACTGGIAAVLFEAFSECLDGGSSQPEREHR